MRVTVSSVLDCSALSAWGEVNQSDHLLKIAAPLARIRPLGSQSLPVTWGQGETYFLRCRILGFLPLGIHRLTFTRIDSERLERNTMESNRLVYAWEHRVSIHAINGKRCLYSDVVDIEAGWLTPLVWIFAQGFYRYRQRKWNLRLQAA